MKIIPSRKLELITSLSKEEVEKILAENTQPKKTIKDVFQIPKDEKVFEGSYTKDSFDIQRVITYRNAFKPNITGKIIAGAGNTKILAEIKMHEFVLIFMVIWLGVVGLAAIGGVFLLFAEGIIRYLALVPIFMFLFGFALVYFGYKYEADKAENELKRIFKARIRDNRYTNKVYH